MQYNLSADILAIRNALNVDTVGHIDTSVRPKAKNAANAMAWVISLNVVAQESLHQTMAENPYKEMTTVKPNLNLKVVENHNE